MMAMIDSVIDHVINDVINGVIDVIDAAITLRVDNPGTVPPPRSRVRP